MAKSTEKGKLARLVNIGVQSWAHGADCDIPVAEEAIGKRIFVAQATIRSWRTGEVKRPDPELAVHFAEVVYDGTYLSYRWVYEFLDQAGVPDRDAHHRRICGDDMPNHVNWMRSWPSIGGWIARPEFGQFVERPEVWVELNRGVMGRSDLVIVYGFGGVGKTSLVLEYASRIKNHDPELPQFNYIVYFTEEGEDRAGSLKLDGVLHELAYMFRCPILTQQNSAQKQREIHNLLAEHQVLLILDNAETISDPNLLSWVQDVQAPAKVIVTTRDFNPLFWRGAWPVPLTGMSAQEADELIDERIAALRLKTKLEADERQSIIDVTGGHPLAIKLLMGAIKTNPLPIRELVADLGHTRGDIAETLVKKLFARCWAELELPIHRSTRMVLQAAAMFASSMSQEALADVADLPLTALPRSLDSLTQLALVSIEESTISLSRARVSMHGLVRAFALARLADTPDVERALRERWLGWYVKLASSIGQRWNDIERLDLLDDELGNLQAVIEWAHNHGRDREICQIARGVRYYHFVRGRCEQRLSVDLEHARAARRLDKPLEEIVALAHYAIVVYLQYSSLETAQEHLDRLEKLAAQTKMPDGVRALYEQAMAWKAMRHNQLHMAIEVWQRSFDLRPREPRARVEALRGIADCYLLLDDLDQAEQKYQEALALAKEQHYQRPMTLHYLGLARVACKREQAAYACNDLNRAIEHLATAEAYLREAIRARTFASLGIEADIWLVEGLCGSARYRHLLHGSDQGTARVEREAACQALEHAINRYKRMGTLRGLHEATEARQDLGCDESLD